MATEPKSKPSFTPRRKWGVGFDMTVRTVVVLAVIVMLNHLASVFFHRQYLSEVTKEELSPRTKNLLQSLTNEVKVIIYYDRGDDFYPKIASLLREYQALNPKVQVETVDYLRDAAEAQRVKTRYGLPETSKAEEKNFIIFECEGRSGLILGNMLTDTVVEVDQEKKTYQRRAVAFNGERAFTQQLLLVTTPKKYKAYVLQGHKEHDIESGDEITGYLDFKSLLQQNAVRVEPLTLVGTNAVPLDCNLLIIAGARASFSGNELEKIDQYLSEGGRLFALFNGAFIDYPQAGLERVLAKWGVYVTTNIVTDPLNAINSIKVAPGRDVMVGAFNDKHPASSGLLNFYLNLLAPRVVEPIRARDNATDAPKMEVLFATASSATLINKIGVPARSYPLAVAMEKSAVRGVVTGRGTTRMIVVGDSYFLANEQMKLVANRDFANYALNWLLDRPQFTEGIGPKSFTEFRMTLTTAQMRNLQWLLLGAVPGGILLFGGLVWLRRRK